MEGDGEEALDLDVAEDNNENVDVNNIPAADVGNEEIIVPQHIDTGLFKYLQRTSIGKALLKQRKLSLENNLPLKKTTRSKLTRLVLSREKERILKNISEKDCLDKFIITRDRFEKLTNEIVFIFTRERPGTYFNAFIVNNGKSVLASGKLWNHYNYMKKCLKEDQLLKGKDSGRPTNVLTREELEINNEHITWLSNHLEPWEEVTQRWNASYLSRRLMLSNPELSVYSYMSKFPCLKTQLAKQLFVIDLNLLHPENHFIDEEKWKKTREFLIGSIVQDANTRIVSELVLIEMLNSDQLNSDQLDFLVLYLLCHIVKPKRSGKRKRDDNPLKLSIQERRESFILRVEGANDVLPAIENMKERYLQNHSTYQPFIIAVGTAVNIKNYYVTVNDKLFEIDSALSAVKLSLQIFFSLDCKYPQSTETIWCFLQKVLFGIDLVSDNITIDSSALIGHINTL